MKLKPETIENLRNRAIGNFYRYGGEPRDVLAVPLWAYYNREQYARRTDKWKTYAGNWADDNSGAYHCNRMPAWREIGDAHEITQGIRHTGWYCDQWGDNFAIGFVLQIPARNGEPQFVPGVRFTDWDGITLYPRDRYDSKTDAAYAADSYAERVAEREREYDAQQQAEQQIEDCHESARDSIAAFKRLRAEIDGKAYGETVCSVIRARLEFLRYDVAENMRRARELRADYWLAVRN